MTSHQPHVARRFLYSMPLTEYNRVSTIVKDQIYLVKQHFGKWKLYHDEIITTAQCSASSASSPSTHCMANKESYEGWQARLEWWVNLNRIGKQGMTNEGVHLGPAGRLRYCHFSTTSGGCEEGPAGSFFPFLFWGGKYGGWKTRRKAGRRGREMWGG